MNKLIINKFKNKYIFMIFLCCTGIMFYTFHRSLLFSSHLSYKKSLLYFMCYIKRNKKEIELLYCL